MQQTTTSKNPKVTPIKGNTKSSKTEKAAKAGPVKGKVDTTKVEAKDKAKAEKKAKANSLQNKVIEILLKNPKGLLAIELAEKLGGKFTEDKGQSVRRLVRIVGESATNKGLVYKAAGIKESGRADLKEMKSNNKVYFVTKK